jgi:hypothetical protein
MFVLKNIDIVVISECLVSLSKLLFVNSLPFQLSNQKFYMFVSH